jgi:hypothetical protein
MTYIYCDIAMSAKLCHADEDNDYLALDGLEDDPMLQILGYSITYRIATGKLQARKVFTL